MTLHHPPGFLTVDGINPCCYNILLSFFPFSAAQHCLSLCSYTFRCNYRVLLPMERQELLNREEISQRLIEIQTCSIRRKFSVSLGEGLTNVCLREAGKWPMEFANFLIFRSLFPQ